MQITDDTAIILNATISAFGMCADGIVKDEDGAARLFKTLYATIQGLTKTGVTAISGASLPAAVAVADSVQDDHIVSLITGQKFQSLKRHLSAHGMTPLSYRQRFSLPESYPMVCQAYSRKRQAMAKEQGLSTSTQRAAKAA